MKLRNHQFSTQPPTSEIKKQDFINGSYPRIFDGGYEHPWYKHQKKDKLIRPNPPTKEAIERAKFVDKTYYWSRDDSVRPRKQRVTK